MRSFVVIVARYFEHWAALVRDLAALAFTRQARALRRREMQRWALSRWLESPPDAAGSSKTTITYREATIDDCVDVAQLNVRSWRESFAELRSQSSLRALSVEQRIAMYRARFAIQDYSIFLAENGEHKPIGFADVGRARQSEWQCDGELYAIYVLRAFQRKGVGRRLFDLAAAAALARGMRSLCVIVLRDSPYRAFYEKLGGRKIFESVAGSGDADQAYVVYAWEHLQVKMFAETNAASTDPRCPS